MSMKRCADLIFQEYINEVIPADKNMLLCFQDGFYIAIYENDLMGAITHEIIFIIRELEKTHLALLARFYLPFFDNILGSNYARNKRRKWVMLGT